MKTRMALLSIALLLSAMIIPGLRRVSGQGSPEGYIYKSENPIPEQYLVVLNNDIEASELESTANLLTATYNGVLLCVPYREGIHGFSVQLSEQSALQLSTDPRVGYVAEISEASQTEEGEYEVPAFDPAMDAKPVEPEDDTSKSFEEEPLTGSEGWGTQPALISPLTVTPDKPLARPTDAKSGYFRYGNASPDGYKTISLLGMSGSFLPHIKRLRNWDLATWQYDPIKENCTLDDVGAPAKAKYKFCVDALVQSGMNHLQIWVSLNHSVGMMPRERRKNFPMERVPYNNEQPFKWEGKWDLKTGTEGNNLDSLFFSNLRSVVSHCQSRGIIVAVVLFDPWQGWNKQPAEGAVNQPIYSPYYKLNNKVTGANSPYPDGVEFTDPHNVVRATKANPDPANDFIDDDGPNRFMRNVQIAVMQRTVKELKDLHNFYWVLANEADYNSAAFGKPLIVWHRYMARILRTFEDSKNGGRHHLIAANLSTRLPYGGGVNDNVLEVIKKDGNIDIINSHYVAIRESNPTQRFSAIKLLEEYNIYTPDGLPDLYNNKRWGFTEGKTTGTAGDVGNPDPLTADAARVEAWEFLMNGGALFDHLSYRWANPNPVDNKATPPKVLNYYRLLSQFLNPISLDGMKRMTTNQTNKWIATPAANIAPHWAAMSNGTNFFLYMHRSTYKLDTFDRYKVNTTGIAAGNMVTVQNMGCGTFRADWFYPDGKAIGGLGGTENGLLKAFGGGQFPMVRANSTKAMATPSYDQDIVVRINKLSSAVCQP
jgi:hypothetical protein